MMAGAMSMRWLVSMMVSRTLTVDHRGDGGEAVAVIRGVPADGVDGDDEGEVLAVAVPGDRPPDHDHHHDSRHGDGPLAPPQQRGSGARPAWRMNRRAGHRSSRS